MTLIVLDASLALRWVLPDEGSEPADEARQRWEQGEVDVAVPSLFWAEVANSLFQAFRRCRIGWDQAQEAQQWFSRTGFHSPVPDAALIGDALAIAKDYGLSSSYDAIYLALGRQLGAEVWHADIRLDQKLQARGDIDDLCFV